MSGCVADPSYSGRQPYDYKVSDPEEFLDDYRYTLVNIIEVEHAIPWLMQYHLLDREDKEIILNSHTTSVLKADELLNHVQRRGSRGFNALMEFIEYEYPKIYKKVMGKPAREPDTTIYVPVWKRETQMSKVFRNGINQIVRALEDSKSARKNAQRSIEELKEKIESFEIELEMKHEQIVELSSKTLELETRNKELMEQLQQAHEERAEAEKKQEILRRERDKYRNRELSQRDQFIKDFFSHMKKHPSRTASHPALSSDMFNVNETQTEHPSETDSEGNEVQKLRAIIRKLETDKEKLEDENKWLEHVVDNVRDRCDMFDSSIIQYKDQVNSLQEERDEILQQFEDLKEKHEKLQRENNYLKESLIKHQSSLRIYKNENSIQRSHKKAEYCPCQMLEQSQRSESDVTERVSSNELLQEFAPVPVTSRGLNAELFHAMKRSHQGTRKHALILYGPEPLHFVLHRHLLSKYKDHFMPCPYEVLYDVDMEILTKLLEAGRCLHYTDLGGGTYRCLGSDMFDIILHSDTCKQVLLDVPVEALPRLTSQNIRVHLLVIKYKHLQERGEKSAEELGIEKIFPDHSCQYDVMLVDQNTTTDSIASMIVQKYGTEDTDGSDN